MVKITTAKIYELSWSNGQNWSFLTTYHVQNRGCHGHGQCFIPPSVVGVSRVGTLLLSYVCLAQQDTIPILLKKLSPWLS